MCSLTAQKPTCIKTRAMCDHADVNRSFILQAIVLFWDRQEDTAPPLAGSSALLSISGSTPGPPRQSREKKNPTRVNKKVLPRALNQRPPTETHWKAA